jgi:F0F1-type ATP synthase membrane subunit c/vacuolar-type H+-ATPase subunit K
MMKWFQQDEKNDSHRAHRQAQAAESTATDGSDSTQDLGGRGRIDLIDLIDFDVHIAVTNNLGIQIFEVTDIVTEWMADSFDAQLEAIGYSGPYADFNTVVLLEREDRRALQASAVDADGSETATENGELYKAKFKGAALFTRADDQLQVPGEVVESIQRTTLINDVALLEALQISGATGLGSAVIDVRAFVNAVEVGAVVNNSEGGDNLEIVIIIAIVVAAVAFLFLVFAIVWAWRYEKTNRDAYLVNAKDSKDKTGSDPDSSFAESKKLSPKNTTPVQEVDVGFQNDVSLASLPGNYRTESVISDDISTSLSQYYRSGMADHRGFARSNSNHLNDAASISSMESYGYSLDGYSPSLATPHPSDITGAKERAIGLAQDFDDEPEDDVSIPMNNAAPEDPDESVADLK